VDHHLLGLPVLESQSLAILIIENTPTTIGHCHIQTPFLKGDATGSQFKARLIFRDREQVYQRGGLFQQLAGGESVANSSPQFLKYGPNLLWSIHAIPLKSVPMWLYCSLAGGVPINDIGNFIFINNWLLIDRVDGAQ
jgi:hypothetical protein